MKTRTCIALVSVALLAGCSPSETDTANPSITPEAEVMESASSESPPVPDRFEGTAWRADGSDGARYVTFLDTGGRYRDLRNGDPLGEGAWSRGDDGAICFVPDGADGLRRCWSPDRMTAEDRMVVTGGANGNRVELVRADYVAPQPENEPDE